MVRVRIKVRVSLTLGRDAKRREGRRHDTTHSPLVRVRVRGWGLGFRV